MLGKGLKVYTSSQDSEYLWRGTWAWRKGQGECLLNLCFYAMLMLLNILFVNVTNK